MDEKIYTVKLADGTVLSGLTMNGNNFISNTPIDADIFKHNCSPVVISDGETAETHEHMDLIHAIVVNGRHWFALRDLTKDELEKEKLKSDLEYLAMMCDVEL